MKIDKSNIDKYINGEELSIFNMGVTSIEWIPNHITRVYCSHNHLSQLPKLPTGLTNLYCSHNVLTNLPKLPDSLRWLDCNYNHLSSYPQYGSDKQWMVNHNKLLNRVEIINKINETR